MASKLTGEQSSNEKLRLAATSLSAFAAGSGTLMIGSATIVSVSRRNPDFSDRTRSPKRKCSGGISKGAAADLLRRHIQRAELAPGQWLVESDICEMLGATRATLRNALRELSHEGLVEQKPSRGSRVRIVDVDEALNIAEVCRILEIAVVSEAAARIVRPDIDELQGLVGGLETSAFTDDACLFSELTQKMSRIYLSAAGQTVAADLVVLLSSRMALHRLQLVQGQWLREVALPHWRKLIDAICRRDGVAASDAIESYALKEHDALRALALHAGKFDGAAS